MFGKYQLRLFIVAAFFLTFYLAAPACAVQIETGDMVSIPSGVIRGPLFISGSNLIVNADVDGDVFAAGQSIVINGKVNGDVFAIADSVRINGNILGDVRSGANSLEITGVVGGSITGGGNSVSLRDGASIKKDAVLFGNSVEITAPITGQFMGSANQIQINSQINDEIRIWTVENLVIGPSAEISGKLSYRSNNKAQISPGAKVGEIIQLPPRIKYEEKRGDAEFSWFAAILWLTTGVLLWGAIYLLFPGLFPGMGKSAQEQPWAVLGWGFLVLLVVPIAVIVLMITVIGIPLALILLLAYIIILFMNKIIAGDFLARCLSQSLKWEDRVPFIVPFLIAFVALIMISRVPVLGFIINLAAASFALGLLALYFYNWRTKPPAKSEVIQDATIDKTVIE